MNSNDLARLAELSFISYVGFWHNDSKKVIADVTECITKNFPDESIVWGPAVHKHAVELVTDSLVYIVKSNEKEESYTVVVRGTNPLSIGSWVFQDFQVHRLVDWTRAVHGSKAAGAQISQAAYDSLLMHLQLKDKTKITLQKFLLNLAKTSRKVAIECTGHSLGGLIAPALALWLHDTLLQNEFGSIRERVTINAYGFAGPTAGNSIFSDYTQSSLNECIRYANPLDIAVHAWNESDMKELAGLYESVHMQIPLRVMYDLSLKSIDGKGYTQLSQKTEIASKVHTQGLIGKYYLAQAIYQHFKPYLNIIGEKRKNELISYIFDPIVELFPHHEFSVKELIERMKY